MKVIKVKKSEICTTADTQVGISSMSTKPMSMRHEHVIKQAMKCLHELLYVRPHPGVS